MMGAMKKLFYVMVLVCVAISGCRVSDKREFEVKVPAMTSEADVQKVREALRPLVGVDQKETVYDPAARTVKVRYDSMQVAHKNIEITIAEAGYEANGIPAIPKALAR